jgi:flavodoxin/Pyruvate/2-oxoacid:ferredoxin oxidoreductase delta subunit
MSIKIFYFSGTGNSFYVAKKIANQFLDHSIQSISEFQNDNEIIVRDEAVVIVCPIYFYDIPPMVKEFLERLKFTDLTYLSFIFTAEYPNGMAVKTIQEICSRKGVTINSCFYLQMPTNYVIKSKMLTPPEIEATLNKVDKKLEKIIGMIKARKTSLHRDSKLYAILVNAEKANSKWKATFPEFDAGFTASDLCNGCKVCEKHCPEGNIVVLEKPTWQGHCAACLKCINCCPKQAIQYDNQTEGRIRYFNPKVKINEFL